MSRIFISYRRDDSLAESRAIFERLAHEFGPTQVFIDVEGLELGLDFEQALNRRLNGCDVMLVVIGHQWLDLRDADGERRLDDPDDFVRIEVETGLQRDGLFVIPVLINGAPAPKGKHLPESLRALARRQALQLDFRAQFDAGMKHLVGALGKMLAGGVAVPAAVEQPVQALRQAQGEREGGLPQQQEPDASGPVDGGQGAATIIVPKKPQIWLPPGLKSSEQGEDDTGPWLDVAYKGVVQRFRWIRPGSFIMGSRPTEEGRSDNEGPRHRVRFDRGFWMADTACTQALWQAVVGENPSHFKDASDLPVEQVSWDDVVQKFLPPYRQALGSDDFGLPTEAQWEYACRAGTSTPYWFGDQPRKEALNINGFGRGKTVPVKDYLANAWGLYQMHGNVWEWCDGYLRDYSPEEQADPPDEQHPVWRALRGGSWHLPALYARAASRADGHRALGSAYVGFRLVLRSTIEP